MARLRKMQDYYSGNDFFPVVSAFRKLKRATSSAGILSNFEHVH